MTKSATAVPDRMTGDEAIARALPGRLRVRSPQWANPRAYAVVTVVDVQGAHRLGPWLHLYDRATQEAIGEPTPQEVFLDARLRRDFTSSTCEPYDGPRDPADVAP